MSVASVVDCVCSVSVSELLLNRVLGYNPNLQLADM